MTARVDIRPEMLRWAIERSRFEEDAVVDKVPQLKDWLAGEAQPTLKQLEKFAKAVRVALGYLFLPEPPEEKLPIPDFRTVEVRKLERPSPDLLDTIYTMQRRQDWLREDRIECEVDPLEFVGSAKLTDDPSAIGREMRLAVGLADGWAARITTWELAVGELRRLIEELGVIAVINGVVGNNGHRKLDVEEFRGFALSDQYAPAIFVNGADAKSAQMFTLAHELAHLWLGQSALTDVGVQTKHSSKVETWCDRAAAEFLVPAQELRTAWKELRATSSPFLVGARAFKVSPIVIGRRAMDLNLVSKAEFFTFYEAYTKQERQKKEAAAGGGDFYRTQNNRVGEMFAREVVFAALDGRVSFKEAYSLTGLNGGAFQEYAERLGVKLP
jgi:Zn-dependent peptidase ImmA (M78 family)